jgi:hypothetical protein
MSGNGEVKYPKWQCEFQEAVVELNRENLFAKIEKFETAIFLRLQELAFSSDHHSEREAIADATKTIVLLKKDKLSNPAWN